MLSIHPGTHIVHNWHKSVEGKEYFKGITRNGKRRTFGCLESPMLSTHLKEPHVITYKLCLAGKTAVGKSSTVAKLTGQPVPMTHSETPGIVTSIAFWPAKLVHSGKPVMFRLQFWDAGDGVQKKFDHIQPACRDNAHAILFLFSFIDRSSFEDLRNQLSKAASSTTVTSSNPPLKVIIGTKYDQYNRSEITSRELQDFQEQWGVPILKLKNVLKPTETNILLAKDSSAELDDVAPAMNTLVEYLWTHQQVLDGNLTLTAPHMERSVDRKSVSGAIFEDDDVEATYV